MAGNPFRSAENISTDAEIGHPFWDRCQTELYHCAFVQEDGSIMTQVSLWLTGNCAKLSACGSSTSTSPYLLTLNISLGPDDWLLTILKDKSYYLLPEYLSSWKYCTFRANWRKSTTFYNVSGIGLIPSRSSMDFSSLATVLSANSARVSA